jgi:hypothetical protein
VLGEKDTQSLRLRGGQGHGDERGSELVVPVLGQAMSGERLAQRGTRPGRSSPANYLTYTGSGPGLLGAVDDRDRHEGKGLRALPIGLSERAGWDLQSSGHVLHRECDEYPFVSTYEGAAEVEYDSEAKKFNFSVKPIPGPENEAGGTIVKIVT